MDEGRGPLQGRDDEAEKARWRAWVGGADRTKDPSSERTLAVLV